MPNITKVSGYPVCDKEAHEKIKALKIALDQKAPSDIGSMIDNAIQNERARTSETISSAVDAGVETLREKLSGTIFSVDVKHEKKNTEIETAFNVHLEEYAAHVAAFADHLANHPEGGSETVLPEGYEQLVADVAALSEEFDGLTLDVNDCIADLSKLSESTRNAFAAIPETYATKEELSAIPIDTREYAPRVFTSPVEPKWEWDGVSDLGPVIQAAADAGEEIHLPAGEFPINTPVAMNLDGVKIVGHKTTLIVGTAPVFVLNGRAPEISGITFRAESITEYSETPLISIDAAGYATATRGGVSDAVIRDCVFSGCGNVGIGIRATTAGVIVYHASGVRVENCTFDRVTAGVDVSGGESVEVTGCTFNQTSGTPVSVDNASKEIYVSGCTFRDGDIGGAAGIVAGGCENLHVFRNRFYLSTFIPCISLSASVNKARIRENTFSGGSVGVLINGAANTLIAYNVFNGESVTVEAYAEHLDFNGNTYSETLPAIPVAIVTRYLYTDFLFSVPLGPYVNNTYLDMSEGYFYLDHGTCEISAICTVKTGIGKDANVFHNLPVYAKFMHRFHGESVTGEYPYVIRMVDNGNGTFRVTDYDRLEADADLRIYYFFKY